MRADSPKGPGPNVSTVSLKDPPTLANQAAWQPVEVGFAPSAALVSKCRSTVLPYSAAPGHVLKTCRECLSSSECLREGSCAAAREPLLVATTFLPIPPLTGLSVHAPSASAGFWSGRSGGGLLAAGCWLVAVILWKPFANARSDISGSSLTTKGKRCDLLRFRMG